MPFFACLGTEGNCNVWTLHDTVFVVYQPETKTRFRLLGEGAITGWILKPFSPEKQQIQRPPTVSAYLCLRMATT